MTLEDTQIWLERLFEFEYCPECGGDAEDHVVCLVLGNYFARCKHSPFADAPVSDNPDSRKLGLPEQARSDSEQAADS